MNLPQESPCHQPIQLADFSRSLTVHTRVEDNAQASQPPQSVPSLTGRRVTRQSTGSSGAPTKMTSVLVHWSLPAILRNMRPLPTLLAFLVLAAGMSACASSAVRPVAPPDDEVAPRTEGAAPRNRGNEPPRLIAPPPAYGNKVVMTAQAIPEPLPAEAF